MTPYEGVKHSVLSCLQMQLVCCFEPFSDTHCKMHKVFSFTHAPSESFTKLNERIDKGEALIKISKTIGKPTQFDVYAV